MKTIVKGTVIHGSGDGAKLGFPTANLSLSKPPGLPFGVYACMATVGGKKYNGVLHFGPRAVFGETKPQFEVHLFDFTQTIYDETVTVEIRDYIRNTVPFSSVDALVIQIKKDCKEAKKFLKTLPLKILNET